MNASYEYKDQNVNQTYGKIKMGMSYNMTHICRSYRSFFGFILVNWENFHHTMKHSLYISIVYRFCIAYASIIL